MTPINYNSTTCQKCNDKVPIKPQSHCKCGFTTVYLDGLWLITKSGLSYTHQPYAIPTTLKTNLK